MVPACTALIPSGTGPGQFSGPRHISVITKEITLHEKLCFMAQYKVHVYDFPGSLEGR